MSKNIVNDEQLLLTEEIQKNGRKFLAEVEKIYELKKKLQNKKQTAADEIAKLERELAELDRRYLFETSDDKIKELALKKKDIRYEIEDYKSACDTKYNQIVKDMLNELDDYRAKALEEKDRFNSLISEKKDQYQEELKAFEKATREKINVLNNLMQKHIYAQANSIDTSIRYDRTDW